MGECRNIIPPLIFTSIFCVVLLIPHPFRKAAPVHAGNQPLRKAAIVDHLGGSSPNPAFVHDCSSLLTVGGYDVDYYDSNDVTVDFYRTLPSHNYKLIVLRVHSAYIEEYLSLAMFTSEPYTKTSYVYEQLRNRVASGHIGTQGQRGRRYLVITDKFVRYAMEGQFDDTVIFMMGCTGIKRCAASAFIEKGARAYIGWNGPVSSAHTDRATIEILERFLTMRQSLGEAVAHTMKTIGPDPRHKSVLLYWPISAGQYTLQKPAKKAGNRSAVNHSEMLKSSDEQVPAPILLLGTIEHLEVCNGGNGLDSKSEWKRWCVFP